MNLVYYDLKGKILIIMSVRDRKHLRSEILLQNYFIIGRDLIYSRNIVGWVLTKNDLINKYGLVRERFFYR